MLLPEAIKLIDNKEIRNDDITHWADLGCGAGLFTKALAAIIKTGSTITAIDKNSNSLKNLGGTYNGISIETQAGDFTTIQFPVLLDGVLLANALHYVSNKQSFITHLKAQLKKGGHIIIVEYDTANANPWVPYPINFINLKMLFQTEGFTEIELIGRKPSIYGAEMYAVIIKN